MALGAASAISYLHARQPIPIIHRDIKAKNIVLNERLQPKLIDFGVGRYHEDITMTGEVGSPYWIAPEVLRGSRYTEHADIYRMSTYLRNALK